MVVVGEGKQWKCGGGSGVVVVEEINRDVVVVVVEGKQDRVSQKFVPLILRAITFEWIKTLFLEAVYCSIEYMYSEFQ